MENEHIHLHKVSIRLRFDKNYLLVKILIWAIPIFCWVGAIVVGGSITDEVG